MSDSRKEASPVNPEEFTVGQKRAAGITLILGIVTVSVLTTLAYKEKLEVLRPKHAVDLSTFSSKLEFTARYWSLGLLWLFVNVQLVIAKRVSSKAGNPLSGNEKIVEESLRILTNSMEQFLMHIVAQVTLLTVLEETKITRIIPLMNAFYFFGRIFFWIGYPKLRSFGFIMTTLPITLVTFLSLYNLVNHFLDPQFIVFKGF